MGDARARRRLGRAMLGAVVLASAVALGGGASASPLAASEVTRLARGETVVRSESLEHGEHRYVGGITYTVIDGTAAELDPLFDDVASWKKVLPLTRSARLVGRDGDDRFVELEQGNALVSATYTLRVRRAGDEVRFWLDPSRPHAIDDAWGFFRLQPFTSGTGDPQVLLTYGILVDVGPGLVRELFEEKVRSAMLSVPQRLRSHVDHLRYLAQLRRR